MGTEQLSYGELDRRAGHLAVYLFDNYNIWPGQPVALMLDRSLDMIVTILGILKAGGAYVPLSPSFPEERLKRMIIDPGVTLLLGEEKYSKTMSRLLDGCQCLDALIYVDSRLPDRRKQSFPNLLSARTSPLT